MTESRMHHSGSGWQVKVKSKGTFPNILTCEKNRPTFERTPLSAPSPAPLFQSSISLSIWRVFQAETLVLENSSLWPQGPALSLGEASVLSIAIMPTNPLVVLASFFFVFPPNCEIFPLEAQILNDLLERKFFLPRSMDPYMIPKPKQTKEQNPAKMYF